MVVTSRDLISRDTLSSLFRPNPDKDRSFFGGGGGSSVRRIFERGRA